VVNDPHSPSAERPSQWEEIFDQLVELAEPERGQRLAELHARDADLASRLERMLAADAAATGFLDRPTLALIATDTAEDADSEELQLPVGTTVGSWRVLSLLGRGGMGEVYLAQRSDPAFTQRAALKIIRRGMDSQSIVRRFVRERQILASLEHPNLARLLDGGTGPDGRPYFALEFVDGEPITTWCDRRALDLDRRLQLMQTVCLAVASAHSHLVVHRDLKPANILVTEDGSPKLLDFGIAKLLAEEEADGLTVTRLGGHPLTPAYAAPEQILGKPVSTATDVYALGVLLYQLITGTLPHRRDQRALHALASAVEHETVERPSAVLRRPEAGDRARQARRVAGDLDLIVMTAVHRDPARRYPSAQALANDLGHFLAGRPIRARPDEVGYRMRKFVARHRLPVAAVLLSLAALVAGLVVALWQAHSARLAASRADLEAKRAERVKSFLVSIFRQSDPQSAEGPTLTARVLLERGAASLDSGLAGEPEVQADLFDAVAPIEDSLGLLEPALAHAQRALALRRRVLPPADGRIGLSLAVLGEALRAKGAMKAATLTFEDALPVLVRAYGKDSLEAAAAQRGLANSLPEPQQSRRCVDLLRAAHAAFVRHLGGDQVESAIVLSELGGALEQDRRYGEAQDAYRRALALLVRRLGPHNPKVAEVQDLLAGLLGRLGRQTEARPLLEAAIATERDVLGPRSEQLGERLFAFGLLLTHEEEYPQADRALTEALAIFGPDNFEAAHCLRYLGRSALKQERYEEAASLLARAVETYRRTLGDDQVQQWRAVADLGRAHLGLGRVGEARREVTEAVAQIERAAGADTYEVLQPLQALGEIQLAAGEATSAVTTLRRVRSLDEKLFGTSQHPDVGGTDLLLARACLARHAAGDRAEARRVLDEGLQIFARTHPQDVRRAESLLESGRLDLADHDLARARADLAAAVPLLAARKGPAHADSREARQLLATASATSAAR
jgi:eukaryotic-like serine/threonine-protein kinase